jgi:hypothetical protein
MRKILVVPPAQRDAVESALGSLLGAGWGAGCLSPWPGPSSAATANTLPTPTAYYCDAHLDDDAAAKVAALVAEDTTRTAADALAVGERSPAEPRKTLRETMAAHAEKLADPKGK